MPHARALSSTHLSKLAARALFGALLISTGCLTTLDLNEELPTSPDMSTSTDLSLMPDSPKDLPAPLDMMGEDMTRSDAARDLDDAPDLPIVADMPRDMFKDMPVEDMPFKDMAPVDMAPRLPGEGLIFSEVIEGTVGNNKAVEIYNATNAPLSLSSVLFVIFSQGTAPSSARTLSLETMTLKTLAPGQVMVLCNQGIEEFALSSCDIANSFVINFNGDDMISIYYDADGDKKIISPGDRLIDSFGQVNNSPPASQIWADSTFQRCKPTPYLSDKTFQATEYYRVIKPEVFNNLGIPPTTFSCP